MEGRVRRARVMELALEATMVVFAVLVALALEEWRQERRLQGFADRARSSVVAELEANLHPIRNVGVDPGPNPCAETFPTVIR